MTTEEAEPNTLRMKHSHAHVTVERRRHTEPTSTVHATQPLSPQLATTATHTRT